MTYSHHSPTPAAPTTWRQANPKTALALAAIAGSILLGAALATVPEASAGAAVPWSVVPSPSPGPVPSQDLLSGVSCASASYCMAIGYEPTTRHGYVTLIEHWDGHRWSVLPSPNKGAATQADLLNGISCASSSSCMAVGTAGNLPLAEHWDGQRWSIVALAAGEDVLNGVSCPAPDDCVAAGYTSTGLARTLIEAWNGTRWSVVPSPNPGPASQYTSSNSSAHALFDGVSCASPTWCAAVGTYVPSSGAEEDLAEMWDGHRWSLVPTPDKSSTANGLFGVSCTSAKWCLAVGDYEHVGYATLTESWDGAKWSLVASPDRGPADLTDDLLGVSCLSARSCVAAGNAGVSPGGGEGATPLVESWNGSKMSIVPSPAKGSSSGFGSVSCPPAGPCAAVGEYGAKSSVGTLIEMN